MTPGDTAHRLPDSARSFADGDLRFEFSDRADDGVLDAFYPAYDRAFVLENEKEQKEGFRECLALNRGPLHAELTVRHGPFIELIAVAREAAGGPVLGGANLLALGTDDVRAGPAPPSVNLNYLFVDPACRGRGIAGRIQAACDAAVAAWAGEVTATGPGLTFLEINDPFRLTPAQYRRDSEHAGIDQVARLGYWARCGARVIDWPYVQPALSASQGDDDTLALAVIGAPAAQLPARTLFAHLQRFFAISVLKGRPLPTSPGAVRQLERLAGLALEGTALDLLPLDVDLRLVADQARRTGAHRPPNLQAALRDLAGA